MASRGQYKIVSQRLMRLWRKRTSMNHKSRNPAPRSRTGLQLWGSACFQQFERYQRRRGAVRYIADSAKSDCAERKHVGCHLAPVR
jgi:hypothetical protein